MIEKQELYCYGCGKYIQFDIDLELNDNHVLECPNCKHEHCRVVENGIITSERWNSRNNTNVINIPNASIAFTSTSTFDTYSQGTSTTCDYFLYRSWSNATTTS